MSKRKKIGKAIKKNIDLVFEEEIRSEQQAEKKRQKRKSRNRKQNRKFYLENLQPEL